MVDLKLGNQTYNGIDRVQINKADSSGVVNFTPSDDLFAAMSGTVVVGLYENPYITAMSASAMGIANMFTTAYFANVTQFVSARGLGAVNKCSCKYFIAPKLQVADNISWNGEVNVLDFTDLTSAAYYSFSSSNLTAVIIRGTNTVPTVGSAANQKANVTVYVPSSMVSAYNNNSGWAALVSDKGWTITALEGSQYENPDWFRTAV